MFGKEISTNEVVPPEPTSATVPSLDSMYNKLREIFSKPAEFTGAGEEINLDDGTIITSPTAKELTIVGSSNLDFCIAYDEYAQEDLYIHYAPEKIENTRITGPNCLAYAYGLPKNIDGYAYDEKPSPGHFAGLDVSVELSEIMANGSPTDVKRVFEHYMKLDFETLGKELKEVPSNDYTPQKGERMFALVTAPNFMGYCSDFHFYVKDKYGCWSHKPGVTNPTIFDNSGSPIKDPQVCDRGDYTNFVGYYVIMDRSGRNQNV